MKVGSACPVMIDGSKLELLQRRFVETGHLKFQDVCWETDEQVLFWLQTHVPRNAASRASLLRASHSGGHINWLNRSFSSENTFSPTLALMFVLH